MQKRIFKLFFTSAWHYPFRTAFAVLGSASASVTAGFVGPFIISLLLEQLQSGTLHLRSAWPLIALYGLAQIYGEIIGWRFNLFFTWTMETAAERDLYQKIFSTLTNQSLNFHANRFGGALVSQVTKLIGSFERFWDTVIFQFIPVVASIAAAITIMSFIFWQYAVVLGALTFLFVTAVLLGSRFMLTRNREEAQASTATNAYVADAVTNVVTIKSHGSEQRELENLTKRTVFWRGKSLSVMKGFLLISSGYSFLMATLNISALLAPIWASEQHIISIGVVYLCVTYTFTVARQLWEMNSIMRNYNRIMGDAHDMTEILSLKPTVIDHSKADLIVTNGAIVFDKVDFSHHESGVKLFDGFDLTITAGKRLGLVGHSGSGKTSLTQLLLRFADVDGGRIMIDDQDISQVSQRSLRRSIAYVPQEPMLFHRTLRENIAYGKPDATEQEILDACKKAHALEFIDKLPGGLETLVGERGVKLSGGQRQRIAIARAILKDAPILVLDEATSALDSESERLIQDALTKLMKDRTSIVIAHRLSTIAQLDKIVVLDNGNIKEQGTHTELLKHHGTYAKLWSHQSGGFIEE